MRLALTLAALVAASPAGAASIRMTCSNTAHEYLVHFDDMKRTFRLNDDTSYGVLSIEHQPQQIIVAGTTVGEGPTFRAVLGQTPHIDFFQKNKLFQTDRCRY